MRIATHPEAIKHLVKIGMASDISEHIKMVESANESLIKEKDELRSVAEDNKRECEATRIENARLKSLCDNLGMGGKHTITEIDAENARLKAEVEELKALTVEMDSTINVSQAACREYKAEVERLEEIVGSDAIDRKYGMCCDASDEVARLKAEVERLTAFTTRTIIPNEELQAQVERVGAENAHLHKGIYSLSLNVAQLKDEVERLTKAGDELHAFLINYIVESRISSAYLNKLDDGWQAAKEGKPRA